MAELKYIENVRNMDLEIKLIPDEFDNRLKLDEYKCVVVKIYDLIYVIEKLAKSDTSQQNR